MTTNLIGKELTKSECKRYPDLSSHFDIMEFKEASFVIEADIILVFFFNFREI